MSSLDNIIEKVERSLLRPLQDKDLVRSVISNALESHEVRAYRSIIYQEKWLIFMFIIENSYEGNVASLRSNLKRVFGCLVCTTDNFLHYKQGLTVYPGYEYIIHHRGSKKV